MNILYTSLRSVVLCCSILTMPGIAEDRWLSLSDDLSAFEPPTGEWFVAGDARVAPEDDRHLTGTPGRGVLINGKIGNTNNLVTKEKWGDVAVSLEFMIPHGSNSGVKLQGLYEIQIFDSWRATKLTGNDCGGIYPRAELETNPPKYYHIDEGIAPRVNTAKVPGQWQTLDIVFRAPRFDQAGHKVLNARFEKVLLNGKLIHDNVEVAHPTGHVWREPEHAVGPLFLQADHGPVAFRNVRLRPLDTESAPRILKGGFPRFETPLPASATAWEQQKPELRKKLWRLLGDLPPLFTPNAKIDRKESLHGFTREHFTFDNGLGDTVYGYLLIPSGIKGRGPAILYNHYHGGAYAQGKEELFVPAFAVMGNKTLLTGPALVRAGYVVLCIDAYCFGERRFQGPAGRQEEGAETEWSLAKTFLWEGRTLWGMMVRDDILALNYLATRREVDPARIAAMGMSMGSTLTWWTAALDDRIKMAVCVACLTRYQDLIAAGELRYHGIYYFVPGLLQEKIDMESVVGLIAPRPLLTLTGDHDPTSPISGVHAINAFQEHIYWLHGKEENFRGLVYPGVGHAYTPAMWGETLRWLKKHL